MKQQSTEEPVEDHQATDSPQPAAESGEPPPEATATVESGDSPDRTGGDPLPAGEVSPSEGIAQGNGESSPGREEPEAGESADFAAMLEAAPEVGSTQELVPGEKISGVLSQVKGENAFIDFGGRSEGVIKTGELMGEDGEMVFATGDPLEAFVVSTEEEIVLSRFLSKNQRQADMLYRAFKSGMPVEGKVTAVNKWGLGVEIQGTRAFCPQSQIDTRPVKTTEQYRGQTLQFRILRYRDHGRNIVLSRRALLQAEVDKAATEVRQQVVKGARLQGKVTRLEPFGAFVDLGSGVEGLVHVSEMRHERVEHPREILEEGEEITVSVLRTKDRGDPKKERISLSIKVLEENPWDQVREQFDKGEVVQGTIDALEDYGAFVELAPNVRGMVHVSELAERRVNHPRDVVSIGDKVKVAVLEVDSRRRRLRLSMKQADKMEADSNLEEFRKRQAKEDDDQVAGNALADALRRAGLG